MKKLLVWIIGFVAWYFSLDLIGFVVGERVGLTLLFSFVLFVVYIKVCLALTTDRKTVTYSDSWAMAAYNKAKNPPKTKKANKEKADTEMGILGTIAYPFVSALIDLAFLPFVLEQKNIDRMKRKAEESEKFWSRPWGPWD